MSDEIRMPYGKFKGKFIHEIPSGYLKWMAENMYDEDLCCAADEEYWLRDRQNSHWWD